MIFRDRTRNNVYERVPGAGKKELPMRARTMQAARLMFPFLFLPCSRREECVAFRKRRA